METTLHRRLLDAPPVRAVDARGDRLASDMRGHPSVDRVMYGLSQAANHSILWHGINLIDAVTGGADRRRRALRRSLVLGLEQAVVNGPVKSSFRRDRPDHIDDHPHDLRTPRTSSFPSGHASAGACAATMLSHDLGAAPLWWGLAAAVAWSRVHVGVHHTSDLLGGAAVGATVGAVAVAVSTRRSTSR